MIDVKGIVPFWAALETEPGPYLYVHHDEDSGESYVERISVEWSEKRISKSWFREVDPPYRRGVGVRLRYRIWALHLGVMRRTRSKSDLDVLGYDLPQYDPNTIGQWDGGVKDADQGAQEGG